MNPCVESNQNVLFHIAPKCLNWWAVPHLPPTHLPKREAQYNLLHHYNMRAHSIICHFHLTVNSVSDHLAMSYFIRYIHISLKVSYFDYCHSVFTDSSENQIARLKRIQNNAALLARKKRKRKRDHVTPLLKALHWLPVKFRYSGLPPFQRVFISVPFLIPLRLPIISFSTIFKRKLTKNPQAKPEILRGTFLQSHGVVCLELTASLSQKTADIVSVQIKRRNPPVRPGFSVDLVLVTIDYAYVFWLLSIGDACRQERLKRGVRGQRKRRRKQGRGGRGEERLIGGPSG